MAYEFLDKSGVTWLIGKIKTALAAKQDTLSDATKTVAGKMSAADKTKLDGIAEGANKITKVSELTNDSEFITLDQVPEGAAASTTAPKMDGTAAVGTSAAFARGDHIHPTDTSRAAASDLTSLKSTVTSLTSTVGEKVDKVSGKGLSTNDYTSAEKTKLAGLNNYDDSEVRSLISALTGISFEIVTALPSTGVNGRFYLIAHNHGNGDTYDEYVWVESESKFEKVGNTDVDLSGYVPKTDMDALTTDELSAIWNA
jgi:hypothetical protein